jgi:DNA-binding IclR family transcriptional regulator
MDRTDTAVKSYATMVSVLGIVESEAGVSLTEIADRLGVSKSTAHRHLTSLERHRLVAKADGGYRLGLGLLALGEGARRQREVYRIAKRKLDEVARETGENIWLSVEEDGDVVYLYRASGEHHIDTFASVGHRTEPHLLGAGKVILAFADEDRVDEIIADLDMSPRTDHSITSEAELRAQIEEVRAEGVAYNFQEAAQNLHAVAAPVFRPEGGIYGSISIFGPSNRLTEEKLKSEYRELVLRIAEEINLLAQYG